MSDMPENKPSRFSLSRYLLNECDEEEKAGIESWIASSETARAEFDSFGSSVAEQERTTPGFDALFGDARRSAQRRHEPRKAIPLFFARPAALAAAALVALAVVSGGLIMVARHSPPAMSTAETPSGPATTPFTFRDTLETLLRMTGSFPSRPMELADSEIVAGRAHCRNRLPGRELCGADRTASWVE